MPKVDEDRTAAALADLEDSMAKAARLLAQAAAEPKLDLPRRLVPAKNLEPSVLPAAFEAEMAQKPGAFRVVHVGVLASSRPDLLEQTLTALFATRHVRLRTYVFLNTYESWPAVDQFRDRLDYVFVARRNEGIAFPWSFLYRAMIEHNYHFADPSPDYLCLLQDDIVLNPDWAAHSIYALESYPDLALANCHDAPEHQRLAVRPGLDADHPVIVKRAVRGNHLLARPSFFEHVMPIAVQDHHNNEDWWIVRDAPQTPVGRDKFCASLRGLGDHIGAERSTWLGRPTPELP